MGHLIWTHNAYVLFNQQHGWYRRSIRWNNCATVFHKWCSIKDPKATLILIYIPISTNYSLPFFKSYWLMVVKCIKYSHTNIIAKLYQSGLLTSLDLHTSRPLYFHCLQCMYLSNILYYVCKQTVQILVLGIQLFFNFQIKKNSRRSQKKR